MDAGAQGAPEPARSLGAIVSGVDGDVHNAAICKSVLALTHCFGLKVIAGDVESEGRLAWLQAHGCAELQGCLRARPMPFEAVLEHLAAR